MGRSQRSKNYKKNMRNVDKKSEGYRTRAQLKKEKKLLKKQSQMEKKFLIGIYDNYRKDGSQNSELVNSKLIGTYSTEPIYKMYKTLDSLNCVIDKNGDNSIKVEVWEVSDYILTKIEDSYDYYSPLDQYYQEYSKQNIKSPFGEIILFTFNDAYEERDLIIGGDWIEHLNYERAIGYSQLLTKV